MKVVIGFAFVLTGLISCAAPEQIVRLTMNAEETSGMFPELRMKLIEGVKDSASIVIDTGKFYGLTGHLFFSFKHDSLMTFLWARPDSVKLRTERMKQRVDFNKLRYHVDPQFGEPTVLDEARDTVYIYEAWKLPNGVAELKYENGRIYCGQKFTPLRYRKEALKPHQ